MSKKYFVDNRTGREVVERKPGVGVFTIPKDGKLECNSKEVAESIVRDFNASGLSVVEEEVVSIPPSPKPTSPVMSTMIKDPASAKERLFGGKRQKN